MNKPLVKDMNTLKPPAWLDENERKKMFDAHVDASDTAYFGFRQLRAAEKVNIVLSHFNRVAPKYDFMNSVLSFGIHHAWKRTAIRLLDLKPGDQLLDVCGGTGDLAVLAAGRMGKNGRVCIYDINRAMMETGRERPENRDNAACIHYVQGDAEQIACRENRFDAAIVGFGIRNLTHLEKGFREMYRVLKPGGRVMCLEFSKPVNPLFRWLYDLYSFHIMPWLGEMLTGSREAYTYLPESIRLFPLPHELKAKLEAIGFSSVTWQPLTNGVAVIHRGIK